MDVEGCAAARRKGISNNNHKTRAAASHDPPLLARHRLLSISIYPPPSPPPPRPLLCCLCRLLPSKESRGGALGSRYQRPLSLHRVKHFEFIERQSSLLLQHTGPERTTTPPSRHLSASLQASFLLPPLRAPPPLLDNGFRLLRLRRGVASDLRCAVDNHVGIVSYA